MADDPQVVVSSNPSALKTAQAATYTTPPAQSGAIPANEDAKFNIHFFDPVPGAQSIGLKSLFTKSVKLEVLLDEVKRDEVAYRAMKKVSGDTFDKWFKVKAVFETEDKPHERLTRAVEQINEKLRVKETFKLAWELKMLLGYSIIALGWEDPATLEQPATRIKDINYIHPISQQQIAHKGLVIDLQRNSPTYGQLSGAKVKFKYSVGDPATQTYNLESRTIHSTRFIHWVNYAPGTTDPYGMSAFEPVFDMLTVKKNLDWAFGEAAFQYAARKYVLIAPSNVGPDQWEYIKANWKDFDSLTTFAVKGENTRIDSFGGTGQLNPEPYFDYYVSLLATGLGVPKNILVHEGQTGMEWVLKDYISDIAAIQKTDVEPILMEFYKRLQDNGLLPRGLIQLDWNKLVELDERENSFVKSRLALGHRMQSESILTYLNSGFAVEMREDGTIKKIFVPTAETKADEFTILPETMLAILKKAATIQAEARAGAAPFGGGDKGGEGRQTGQGQDPGVPQGPAGIDMKKIDEKVIEDPLKLIESEDEEKEQ